MSAEIQTCLYCDVCGAEEFFLGKKRNARFDARYNHGWRTGLKPTKNIPTMYDDSRIDICPSCKDAQP